MAILNGKQFNSISAHLSSGCWYFAAIFFMRSLYANSDGGGGGGGAVKERSGLVSAIPGKGNMFRESVCCRMRLPSVCPRAILEGRSKADVSGEDLKSELALRFLGGGGVLSPAAGVAMLCLG